MTDYLEVLLALPEEREEDREALELRETPPMLPEGARRGSRVRKEERGAAEGRSAEVGDSGLPPRSGESGVEEVSALLRREAAERRPEADALFRAVEEATSALERGAGTSWRAEAPGRAGGGAARPGTDGREAEEPGRAEGADSRQTAAAWSGGDGSVRRTAEEKQSAARAAGSRRESPAVGALEQRLSAGLDRRETVPRAAAVDSPAGAGEELLSLEELDRQVRRDARRYDGTLSLY